MDNINIKDLPPEERDLVLQFGRISRPYSEANEKEKTSLIARAYLFLQSLAVASTVWEVYGVDISYWQGDIDFDILKTKAMFVFIRYGYGNDYFDPRASEYVRGCDDRQIPYDGYWFTRPDKSFTKHAENFFSMRKSLGGKMYPIFDEEETGGLGKTALNDWLYKLHTAFGNLSGIELQKQMIYISPAFAENIEENDWMKRTKLDVAHWTDAPSPIIPKFWKNVSSPPTKFTFWQHAVVDSRGYGVSSSKIDVQRYWGTREDFKKEFGIEVKPPSPPPIIVPKRIRINTSKGLNLRTVPTDVGNNPIGVANYNSIWVTTGEYSIDYSGRLWYQVSDSHGTELWLAGWLTIPA